MLRPLALVLLLLTACEDSEARDRLDRADTLAQEQAERIEALERELAAMRAAIGAPEAGGEAGSLAARLDQIEDRLDKLARPRATRPSGASAAYARPDPDEVYAVAVDGAPARGPRDALVTIVKAYEYACPYCERVRGTLAALRDKYGDDLRIVYRHFVVHPALATIPAKAACAAHRQGKFEAMDELIWERGFKANRNLGQDNMEALAESIGLDMRRFRRDLDGACADIVASDQTELKAVGVRGTPGFYINGRHLSGAQPQAAFEVVIDEELAKARQRVDQGTRKRDYYRTWVLDKGKPSL